MLVKEGAVFSLQGDDLDRTYQVQMGAILWNISAQLKNLLAAGPNGLQALGPKGPWTVERIIGMWEFPQAMDEDGKASMIEACVRRACMTLNGELHVKLHQHVREQTVAWCSDGADLKVPLAASGELPNFKFTSWDESHSAQRCLANAMKDADPEVVTSCCVTCGGWIE